MPSNLIEQKLNIALESFLPRTPKALYWREYPAEFEAQDSRAFEKARSLEAKEAIAKSLKDQGVELPLASFSHSRHDGKMGIIGVGVSAKSGVSGIGVDIEAPTRALSAQLIQRLIHETEAKFQSITPLGFWVLKEAAFKSLPKNTGALVSQFIVEKFDEETGIGEMRTGRASFRFKLLEIPNWIIAIAICVSPEFGLSSSLGGEGVIGRN